MSAAVAVLTVLSIVLVPAGAAAGSTVDEPFWCAGTDVNASAPRVDADGSARETVIWSPVLYKWEGGEWARVASANWSIATVTEEGREVTPWADLYGNYEAASRRFVIHAPGFYAVRNLVTWEDGSYQASWVPSPPRMDGYCHFGSRTMAATDEATPDAEAAEVELTERGGLAALLFNPASVVTALVVGAIVDVGEAGINAPPSPSVTAAG